MGEDKPTTSVTMAKPAHHTWKYIRSNLLTVLTLTGILLGITFGCVLRHSKDEKWSQRDHVYIKFGGEIFLRMLKALTLPLLISCVITALGSLELRVSGKVGIRTGLFYLTTSVCAVVLGIVLVITIRPGIYKNHHERVEPPTQLKLRKVWNGDVLMDIVRNMFPSNLFQATMNQYQTIMDVSTLSKNIDDANIPTKSRNVEATNLLGLLIFSTIFGLALSSLGPYGKAVLKFFRCLSQIMMIISGWILWLAPVGVFFLLAGKILEVGDIHDTFHQIWLYLFTVLLGLITHALVVLPILYFVITGSHPFKVMGNVIQALVTAFGTASSSATLPATVACVEDKNGVDPRIARFVLPIGAILNMDGTALYEAVAALFLAQLHGISLDLGSILAVSLFATIASVGASGIPQAGMVTMIMMANILGLPAESIAFLIPVDFILDRCRTAVNVLGDALGASLVDKLCKEEMTMSNEDDSFPSKNSSVSTLAEEV